MKITNVYNGVNSRAQGCSVEDTMTDDSYFNISEIKLSITSLYIISDAPEYNIIWTENSELFDSFISEILKYESSVIQSLTAKPWAVLFTPFKLPSIYIYIYIYIWYIPRYHAGLVANSKMHPIIQKLLKLYFFL